MLKPLIILAGAITLSVLKVGLFSLWPFPWSAIDPILIAVILVIFIFNFNSALALALSSSFIIEIFSAAPFGIMSITIAATALSANWLARGVFTNRSWPALLSVGLSATLIYRIVLLGLYGLVSLKFKNVLAINIKDYFLITSWELLLNSAALTLGYLIIYKSTKKLQTSFV